jgi:hypothetical protein
LAGAGKLFENGTCFLPSEVNTFMMEQQIMVFAGTELGVVRLPPSEGMFAFLKALTRSLFTMVQIGLISNGCRRFQRVRCRGNP